MARLWGLERTAEGVSVWGEIDLAAADDFAEAACEAARDGPHPFVIDMLAVTFIDSSGIHALARIADVLKSSDIVIRPSEQVFRVLRVAGLTGGWNNIVVLSRPGED
jgi:anti-anti-sigma factor